MDDLSEARGATRKTVNDVRVEKTDDVAAAGLADQWRERAAADLDDGSMAPGTLVEGNGQLAFGGAQLFQDAFDGLELGNVDSSRQPR